MSASKSRSSSSCSSFSRDCLERERQLYLQAITQTIKKDASVQGERECPRESSQTKRDHVPSLVFVFWLECCVTHLNKIDRQDCRTWWGYYLRLLVFRRLSPNLRQGCWSTTMLLFVCTVFILRLSMKNIIIIIAFLDKECTHFFFSCSKEDVKHEIWV